MKRKMFLIVGGLALITGSVFAGRASVRATATSLYARNIDGTGGCFTIATGSVNSNLQTILSGTDQQATIKSASGTQYNVFQNSDCTNDVKFL